MNDHAANWRQSFCLELYRFREMDISQVILSVAVFRLSRYTMTCGSFIERVLPTDIGEPLLLLENFDNFVYLDEGFLSNDNDDDDNNLYNNIFVDLNLERDEIVDDISHLLCYEQLSDHSDLDEDTSSKVVTLTVETVDTCTGSSTTNTVKIHIEEEDDDDHGQLDLNMKDSPLLKRRRV